MIHFLRMLAADPDPYHIDVSPLPHATADNAKIQTILTLVFMIVGVIALLMVTLSGFRYITSQGDPQAVSKAKQALLYSLIGVAVSVTAVALVTFVMGGI